VSDRYVVSFKANEEKWSTPKIVRLGSD